jgi:deazaflavin-dependent oxidoreductase (nitroreductase family)
VAEDAELAELDHCYVTTIGRRSGSPHTIEIWFALHEGRVYLLSGGADHSDWVKNIGEHPTVGLRIGDRDMIATATQVTDPEEDELARRLLVDKYRPRYAEDLSEWGRTALPIVIELPEPATGE